MKFIFYRLAFAMLLVITITTNCSAPSMLSSIASNPQLSSIAGLLKQTGLDKTLLGGGSPLTFLAPTNDALSKLGGSALTDLAKPENLGNLTNMLKKHIIPGNLDPTALLAGGLTGQGGNPLNFIKGADGKVKLGDMTLGDPIKSKGGTIYPVDGIIQ
ncbi:fasciclin domain-containing protein [Solitalea sp. MAHUQ-68]|uniref:Fasciclin domain-containing protein n=1 Tax=Solitalea agri TaxID=2953739 RepID=A0A9X2JDS8_9SPHI|nr:fasciclin domain-containing protein [Solitalea agri]MCO4291671.1 fasciclin domain-containing protein [Solitalea agri]